MKQLKPVRPRDDRLSGPPRDEGSERGDDDEGMEEEDQPEDIYEDGYPPTSPASSVAGEIPGANTGDFGVADDGAVGSSSRLPQSKPDGEDWQCKPCDERVPMMLPSPTKPSKEDVERHYSTHLPYRCWCPVCIKAKGKEDAHARDTSDEKIGLPIISMDYCELDDIETEKRSNKTLVIKDEHSGALLQYRVLCKGAGDDWVVKRAVRDIEEFGRTDIRLKTDGEPAIVALQSKIIEARKPRTVPINPPAYNPQSNGSCEKGVQDATAETRALKIGLEARIGVEIPDDAEIMEWIYIHAAFLVTRYSVGHDGMVPWERLTGSKWHRPAIEIGEVVLAKLASRRGGKMVTKQKKKLKARSVRGVLVGQVSRTGEHIVVVASGDAVRCRTIFRVPEGERWDKDLVLAIQGTPRTPAPSRRQPDRLDAQLVDDRTRAQRQLPRRERRQHQQDDGQREDSGAALRQPEVRGPRMFEPRHFKITDRILAKYGYSDDCKGCSAKRNGIPSEVAGDRAHSAECRKRLSELMSQDQHDRDVVSRDAQKFEDDPMVDEPNNAQTAQLPESAKESTDYKHEPTAIGDDALFADNPDDTKKGTNTMTNVETDDDPDGIPELNEDDMLDDDDEGLEEPNSKRQRLRWIAKKSAVDSSSCQSSGDALASLSPVSTGTGRTGRPGYAGAAPSVQNKPLETTVGRTLAGQCDDSDRAHERVACLNMLEKVRGRSDVQQIIKELEELPKFRMRECRQERKAMRAAGTNDVSEIYSPPRMAKAASALGLKGGWSLDLTTTDDDGNAWDFRDKNMQKMAMQKVKQDKPYLLVLSPMCGPFSELQQMFNYPGTPKEEVKKKLEDGLEHIDFCIKLCIEQYRQGRAFMMEHPASASTWTTEMVKRLKRLPGTSLISFDFCMLDMKTKDEHGNDAAAKKRTSVLTNSPSIQLLLREAQCRREHRHQHLLNGTAKACEIYPDKCCRLICEAVKRDIDNLLWRDEQAKVFDVTQPFGKLMALQSQAEKLMSVKGCTVDPTCPPEEDPFAGIYDDMEFVDDVTGEPLDKEEATAARRLEMEFFKQKGVYTKVKRQAWMKVISTKWLDVNKGDSTNRNYRARLVGREIKRDKREDLFAATPPLESLRMILSICAGHQHERNPSDNNIIMTNDVKRAYFHAAATRPIFIQIPKEDREDGDNDKVGQLNLSLYGTRDAAQNWARTVSNAMTSLGFTIGEHSPCNFRHEERNIALTIHGDDFTSTGREAELRWLDCELKKRFELKTEFLGPDPRRHVQQLRVLNRVISWQRDGLTYEADQRHAELLIRELGLEYSKPVATAGSRDDMAKASTIEVNDKGKVVTTTDGDDSPLLAPGEATKFRALTARANYLAQDRPEAQYAIKEVARRMATPRERDWHLLKRLGRYLIGAPRAVFNYYWQRVPTYLDVFVDSDWAGCKGTCRSTSGGGAKAGFHTIKTWSTTQAVVALSSGEAELYALTKGAAIALGIASLAADFGLQLHLKLHTDASAAVGIVHRQGVGKLRHVRVQYLWVQSKVQSGELAVGKINGKDNPADLMTKNLAIADVQRHLQTLCIEVLDDRAAIAPKLARAQPTSKTTNGNNNDGHDHDYNYDDVNGDDWMSGGIAAAGPVRIHRRGRLELFTPRRVEGAPPCASLTPVRITCGEYLDTGEKFKIVDTWTSRPSAHRRLARRWTGTTRFISRSEC